MEIKSVLDPAFRRYGRVLEGYDFTELCEKMMDTECPADHTIYVAGDPVLEALPVCRELKYREYGGMEIQIGYCNGYNKKLNGLEYHRSSEINIPAGGDMILLLGKREDVEPDFTYDTSKVEGFLVPEGVGIEVFATTMHLAPCCPKGVRGFRGVVVLPKGTNLPLEVVPQGSPEDRLIRSKNKWLIAHAEAHVPGDGKYVGLKGDNITVE